MNFVRTIFTGLTAKIISWAGRITDAIDGTAMEVDYVRIYRKKD